MRQPNKVSDADLQNLAAEDWAALVALALEHRCGPYLAQVFSERPKIETPPALEDARQRSLFRTLKVGRECVGVHDLLAGAGIEHLFLKGIPLAFRYYPNPWMRPMRDIDVLVPTDKLNEAYDCLVSAGGTIDAFDHKPVEMSDNGKHLPPIYSPSRTLPLELHYRTISPDLPLCADALHVVEQEIWRSPGSVRVGGAALPVPSVEALLVHLLIHGLYDHELNNGPLFVTDLIHLIRSNTLDQHRFADLVARTGLSQAVTLAAGLLPPEERDILYPGADHCAGLSNSSATALLLQSSSERTELKLIATLSSSTLRGRAGILGRKLFPDPVTMSTRWKMDRSADSAQPKSAILLWLWFIGSRAHSFFRLRTKASSQSKDSLLELRSLLASQPDEG